MKVLSLEELLVKVCEQQQIQPYQLYRILQRQFRDYQPDCWVLLQCVDLSSIAMGNFTVAAVGPRNTLKTVPTAPISVRGMASDMSTVFGTFSAKEMPDLLGPFHLDTVPVGTLVRTLDGLEGKANEHHIVEVKTETTWTSHNVGKSKLVTLVPGDGREGVAAEIEKLVDDVTAEVAVERTGRKRRK
jgi:hypothetical protein